jgi:hypothetical protein
MKLLFVNFLVFFIPNFLFAQEPSVVYPYHVIIEEYDNKYTQYGMGLMILSYNLSKKDYKIITSKVQRKTKREILDKYIPDTLRNIVDKDLINYDPYNLFEINIAENSYDFVFKGSDYKINMNELKEHDFIIDSKIENAKDIFYWNTFKVKYYSLNKMIKCESTVTNKITPISHSEMVDLDITKIIIILENEFNDQIKMTFRIY